jgi:hypothetical protein
MTPQELLSEIDRINEYGIYFFDRKEILALIEQSKSEWCKEQREYCANILKRCEYSTNDPIKKMILNAPEP